MVRTFNVHAIWHGMYGMHMSVMHMSVRDNTTSSKRFDGDSTVYAFQHNNLYMPVLTIWDDTFDISTLTDYICRL
nr:TPA: hypothetical protein [Oryctes rhinoceros nudivirus]